jgi:hypothetical protein
MTNKALIKQLETACYGLDPVDPLRLLVDDVIAALRENAMREIQRLGQEIEQEPVAWINVEERKLEWAKPMSWNTPTTVNIPKIPLYTTPPQRTWVDLTDEEIDNINYTSAHMLAREVLAKLKERNT